MALLDSAELLRAIVTEAERAVPGQRICVALSVRAPDGTTERWGYRADEALPAASTIKVAILAAVRCAIERGELSEHAFLPVTAGARVGGSGVLNWMAEDLQLTVRDLAFLMIAISDNTASNVLIDAVGLDGIAEVTQSLGFERTAQRRRFLGRLPGPGEPENEASAAELVRLFEVIWNDEVASPAGCQWMRDLLALQQHRDRIGRCLPEGVVFAGKSGSLEGYVHDSGVVSGPGGRATIAVLTSGVADEYAMDAFIGNFTRTVIDAAGIARGPLA